MVILVVGGLDRLSNRHEQLAKQAGHRLECHDGCVAGRGQQELDARIDRADLVVVVTEVNSHAAVSRARSRSRAMNRRCLLIRKFGTSRLQSLLAEIAGPEPLKVA